MDKIVKIPDLTKNTADTYVRVGASRSYLEKISVRLPVTNDTTDLNCGLIAKRLQQTIDAVNKIIEGINNGLDTQGH